MRALLTNQFFLENIRNIIRDSLLGNTFLALLISECIYIWGSAGGLIPKILLTVPFTLVILSSIVLFFCLIRTYLQALPIRHKFLNAILMGLWILITEITLIFSIVNFIHKLRPL